MLSVVVYSFACLGMQIVNATTRSSSIRTKIHHRMIKSSHHSMFHGSTRWSVIVGPYRTATHRQRREYEPGRRPQHQPENVLCVVDCTILHQIWLFSLLFSTFISTCHLCTASRPFSSSSIFVFFTSYFFFFLFCVKLFSIFLFAIATITNHEWVFSFRSTPPFTAPSVLKSQFFTLFHLTKLIGFSLIKKWFSRLDFCFWCVVSFFHIHFMIDVLIRWVDYLSIRI